MQTENIFIVNPTTIDQLNALKAVVKTLKVKFELKKETTYDISDDDKAIVLDCIQTDQDEDLLDWNAAKKQLKRK